MLFAASVDEFGRDLRFFASASMTDVPTALLIRRIWSEEYVKDLTPQGASWSAHISSPAIPPNSSSSTENEPTVVGIDNPLPGVPVAVNDAGNVLVRSYGSPFGSPRYAYNLSGPPTQRSLSPREHRRTDPPDGGSGCAICAGSDGADPLTLIVASLPWLTPGSASSARALERDPARRRWTASRARDGAAAKSTSRTQSARATARSPAGIR